ncbi:MAG: hypothetical protein HON55_02605, partial [Legionellales bacterium]|nr:hypothetical protein [Legionellales bacterium]
MTGWGSKTPRNDGRGHRITRIGAITGMAGLRRRCNTTLKLRDARAPRNDGMGEQNPT